MPDETDEMDEPQDAKRTPAQRSSPEAPAIPASASPDPNDIVPVPVAMEPAEIDERAKVVEALRAKKDDAQRDGDARREPDR